MYCTHIYVKEIRNKKKEKEKPCGMKMKKGSAP